MAFPPSNKKLVITFVQSTVSGLLIALVLQSSPLAKSSKLQPNCNVVGTVWKKFKIQTLKLKIDGICKKNPKILQSA